MSTKIYKTLMKGIEEDKNKWKGILCLWIGRTGIIEWTKVFKEICIFNANPTKIPMSFFTELLKKTLLKICMKLQKTLKSQGSIEQEQRWRHYTS